MFLKREQSRQNSPGFRTTKLNSFQQRVVLKTSMHSVLECIDSK